MLAKYVTNGERIHGERSSVLNSAYKPSKHIVLSEVVKTGLIFSLMNAESERSLSVESRIANKKHNAEALQENNH